MTEKRNKDKKKGSGTGKQIYERYSTPTPDWLTRVAAVTMKVSPNMKGSVSL